MSRPGRFAIAFLAALAIALFLGLWVTTGAPDVRLLPVTSRVRGRVRVWQIFYRAHNGALRAAYVDLPRWYGLDDNPRLPLIISPHGRQASARANSALWGDLPALGPFAVVNPEGQGRVLERESWGDPGQISDLARMPRVVRSALPWLRLERHRVYGFGGSMGGQEVLLLAARYPHLLAGAAAFDAPTDLARRYRDFRLLPTGALLRRLMRAEVGGTPAQAPAAYAARSPLSFARRLAFSRVRLELWWSRADQVVVGQAQQSGRLYREIKRLNTRAPVEQVVGRWGHTAELSARRELPDALLALGLLPLERLTDPLVAASSTSRSTHVARPSLCTQLGGPGSYPWPLKPFHEQHPVRGVFGDPRTVFRLDGFGAADAEGSFTFHNGVDVVAVAGTAVYPVVSGVVDLSRPFTVGVRSERRRFEYRHIRPLVWVGERVVAGRTILGRVIPWAQHVHLSESVDGRMRNPLAPGHLTPYRDAAPPVVSEVVFRGASGDPLRPSRLDGELRILASAYDTPAEPLPPAWRGARLAPALITWRLTALRGHPTLKERTVVDFRDRLPAEREFWRIYAPETYQNDPAVGLHYFGETPGQYVFSLTPRPLDTGTLRPGLYLVSVTATDTCGNRGSLTERVRIIRSPAAQQPRLTHFEDKRHPRRSTTS
jgi:poly(3-hydroxybutyrate) depolymerase